MLQLARGRRSDRVFLFGYCCYNVKRCNCSHLNPGCDKNSSVKQGDPLEYWSLVARNSRIILCRERQCFILSSRAWLYVDMISSVLFIYFSKKDFCCIPNIPRIYSRCLGGDWWAGFGVGIMIIHWFNAFFTFLAHQDRAGWEMAQHKLDNLCHFTPIWGSPWVLYFK